MDNNAAEDLKKKHDDAVMPIDKEKITLCLSEKDAEDIIGQIKWKWNDAGLMPAVVQDAENGQVLMLAYMNQQSLLMSLTTGTTWFWSRGRRQFWHKGETSGHYQYIREVFYDCDADTLLIKAEQTGMACHEGVRSCFHYQLV